MLIRTNNKEEAFRAVINVWLKDKSLYCNTCGKQAETYKDVCCENPQVGTNMDHTMGVIKQNKILRQTRSNEFASTDDKTLRFGVSIPPGMYNILDNFKKQNGKERLFREAGELNWFAKHFPAFCIPEKI